MDGTMTLCLVVIVFLIVVIVVMSITDAARRKELQAAYTAYRVALTALRAKPTSSNLRTAALDAGRAYANLSRERKGATIFDEVALKNDLDAATAGAATYAAAAIPVPAAASVADRLRQLDKLKVDGLITEAEYATRREKILGDV